MNFQLLIDLHLRQNRQGPGSDESTLHALSCLPQSLKKNHLRIADIGCGTGASTLVLAQHLQAKIEAVDLFDEFLGVLEKKAEDLGLSESINCIKASMDDLPFEANSFDIIWSEGAIYNMGFRQGIDYWKQFLKKDGFLALSEICWTTAERPEELQTHWTNEYPEISDVNEKIDLLKQAGYQTIHHFLLPENCWLNEYYEPLQESFDEFLSRHQYSDEARSFIEAEQQEIDLYKKYKAYYNYVFLLAQRS